MTGPALGRIGACVFDAYGTLLDVTSPVAAEAAALGSRAGELAALWRRKQLEYTWLRVADAAACRLRRRSPPTPSTMRWRPWASTILPLRARLLAAYRHLAPFGDVGPALRSLREQGMRTAILSNGTTAMLAEGVAAAGIADLVDPVLSVDEVGMFKPAPEVYRLATSRLGLPAAAIAFVSANGWDVHGAASFGLRSVWVNRGRLADDRLPGEPIEVIDDLASLPALARRGVGRAAMMAELPVRFADVAAAADRLRGVAAETPLLESEALNELIGGRLLIKPEPLQRTGSFKFRGAYNAISTMRPPAVVAYSSGNHAQGVAMAARLLGMPATIVMPADAPRTKLDGTRALGAEVITYDRLADDREAIGREVALRTGAVLIRPYDDPLIVAGQGTVGLELAEQSDPPRCHARHGPRLLRRRGTGRRLRHCPDRQAARRGRVFGRARRLRRHRTLARCRGARHQRAGHSVVL